MKIRKYVACMIVAATVIGLGFTDAAPEAHAQETYSFRFSSDSPPSNIKVKAQMKWAELAKEQSDGQIDIRVFTSAQLYNDAEAIPAVSSGAVDMAAPPSMLLTSVVPQYSVFELPALWGISFDQYRNAITGEFGQDLEQKLEDKLGVKVLGHLHMGTWVWGSNAKAITTPSDFEGQKIRIIGNPINEEVMTTFGAEPVQIAWPEVPTALLQGTMDGLETTLSGLDSIKGWEILDYLTISDHKILPYSVIMNRASWEKLPENLQEILVDTLEEARKWHDTEIEQMKQDAIEQFRAEGVEVVVFSDEDRQAFTEVLQDVDGGFSEDSGVPQAAELAIDSAGINN